MYNDIQRRPKTMGRNYNYFFKTSLKWKEIQNCICMHKPIYIYTKSPEWPTQNIFQSQPSKIKLEKKKIRSREKSLVALWGVSSEITNVPTMHRDNWRNGTQGCGFQAGKQLGTIRQTNCYRIHSRETWWTPPPSLNSRLGNCTNNQSSSKYVCYMKKYKKLKEKIPGWRDIANFRHVKEYGLVLKTSKIKNYAYKTTGNLRASW